MSLVLKDSSVKICEGSFIPKELQKYDELVESIVNIKKEYVTKVFEGIKPELVQSAFKIIEHAIEIRPFEVENLLSLFSLLSKKFGYKKGGNVLGNVIALLTKEGIIQGNQQEKYQTMEIDEILFGIKLGKIENVIKEDDLDSFIQFSSEPLFYPNHILKFRVLSSSFVLEDNYDYEYRINN